jgi:hypothetical protein
MMPTCAEFSRSTNPQWKKRDFLGFTKHIVVVLSERMLLISHFRWQTASPCQIEKLRARIFAYGELEQESPDSGLDTGTRGRVVGRLSARAVRWLFLRAPTADEQRRGCGPRTGGIGIHINDSGIGIDPSRSQYPNSFRHPYWVSLSAVTFNFGAREFRSLPFNLIQQEIKSF